jgi:hypothetical protein
MLARLGFINFMRSWHRIERKNASASSRLSRKLILSEVMTPRPRTEWTSMNQIACHKTRQNFRGGLIDFSPSDYSDDGCSDESLSDEAQP